MPNDTFFQSQTDDELRQSAIKFAEAQEKSAANTNEDFTHWHHIAVRDIILELEKRMRTSEEKPDLSYVKSIIDFMEGCARAGIGRWKKIEDQPKATSDLLSLKAIVKYIE